MDYSESLAYLEKLGEEVLNMKLGLRVMRQLLRLLGDPQRQFASVLVAGTNGKGSVARFLAGILDSSGNVTGLFTSPHLIDVRERIQFGGRTISRDDFAGHLKAIVRASLDPALERKPTYFETLTALAFLHFAGCQAQLAVLEVGLGGRLDSTNVVTPELSIITPIALDHQRALGNSLDRIAFEKAGIIHPARPVIVAGQEPAAARVLIETARRRKSPLLQLRPSRLKQSSDQVGRFRFRFGEIDYRLQTPGAHQVNNAALALLAAQQLKKRGWPVTEAGSRKAIANTRLPSALYQIGSQPDVYLDGAHNPAAAAALAEFVSRYTKPPRHLVLGMMRDKDAGGVARTLSSLFSRVFLTRIPSPRAAEPASLLRFFSQAEILPNPSDALAEAGRSAGSVIVTGSLFLVGTILEHRLSD